MADINAHIMVVFNAARTPHLAEQMALRHDLTDIGQERTKQTILDGRKANRNARLGDHSPSQINVNIAELDKLQPRSRRSGRC